MDVNTTTSGNGGNIMSNEYVQELFSILQDNGKDTAGLTALIDHVKGMEDFVKNSENQIASMKSQLNEVKEIQDHPIKHSLQNTIKALETRVAEIKERLGELKNNIVEGCKNAASAFKEAGASVLNKLASFFMVKDDLQAMKNSTIKSVDKCDKAMAKIETFSNEYHKSGRALKNMARVAVGKQPIDAVKESGKLAKAVSAPYKAKKACMLGIQKQVDKMINALDNLEKGVEARAAAKKPMLERLEEKKLEIKQRELEMPKPERTAKAVGLEV